MGKRIEVESSVTLVGKPFLVLSWGSERGQLSPEEARHHAAVVIEAAEAAEQDAFLVMVMREKLAMTDPEIATMLREFRAFREARLDLKRP
jgi:hypothetical protein